MYSILAFEGSPDPIEGLTWGAAAVWDGKHIHNSISGWMTDWDGYERFLADGTLTQIAGSFPVSDPKGWIVLMMDRERYRGSIFDPLRDKALDSIANRKYEYFLYSNQKELQLAGAWLIYDIVRMGTVLHPDCEYFSKVYNDLIQKRKEEQET